MGDAFRLGIEAERAHLQGLLSSGVQFLHAEALHKPQHPDIPAASDLKHARFHQAAQRVELFGQVPLRKGCGLIQSIDLAFEQRE